MYETYNFLINYIKKTKGIQNLEINYKKILVCFTPIIPHFTNECLNDLDPKFNMKWPDFDKFSIKEDNINYVIQINGKKRSILKEKNRY